MLVYYNLIRGIMLECNTSRFAILAILLQLIEKTSQWHSVAFWLYKMVLAKQNYRARKSKMLAMIEDYKY